MGLSLVIQLAASSVTVISFILLIGYLSCCLRFWALPQSISVIGAKSDGFISRTGAYLRAWLTFYKSRSIAYERFSHLGKPFISPSPSLSPDIVIPPEHVRWLLAQPSSVLAQRPALWEGMAIKYMFPSADPRAEFVPGLVKRHMSSGHVDVLHREIYRQIQHWTDRTLGSERVWKEVSLFDTVGAILARVGYHMYFGPELADNEALTSTLRKLGNWAAVGGLVIGQFSPPLLRRPIGLLFQVPISYYTWKFRKIWEPVMKERLDFKSLKEDEEPWQTKSSESNGFLHSATAGAAQCLSGNRKHTVESISTNFLIMYGVASNVKIPGSLALLLNLICLPEAQAFLPFLREEFDKVLSAPASWKDPDTFAPHNIPLLTAFTRESMRYSPLAANIPVRVVVAKEGVILPDGTGVPCGSWLVCPTEAMTRDERFYPDPNVFNPFRFLEEKSGSESSTEGKKYILRPNCDVTVQSDSFLYFGYGRHFCPGRYFMARMMMLLLAYIVQHYDFKPSSEERPVPIRAAFVNLPPLGTKVMFRRRAEEVAKGEC